MAPLLSWAVGETGVVEGRGLMASTFWESVAVSMMLRSSSEPTLVAAVDFLMLSWVVGETGVVEGRGLMAS